MAFSDTSMEGMFKRFAKIRSFFPAENNIISIPLVDIDLCPIELTEDCTNQLLVKYRNQRYDVLPLGICGGRVKDFLQLRYFRIIQWGALPAPLSGKSSPVATHRDIYYIP